MRRLIIIDTVGEYKAGDPPPKGYLDWHEWARVQDKAGLRQKRCQSCNLWKFPQELTHLGKICIVCAHPGERKEKA